MIRISVYPGTRNPVTPIYRYTKNAYTCGMRLRSIPVSHLALPLLLLATLIVFGQVVSFDFVDWDDTTLILGNELVKTFSPAIFWIFEPELYAPLSLFTFQIEHALAGFDPTIFHLTNLILHLINVVLAWKLLSALAQSQIINRQSSIVIFFAAALFALHPIQSETVAWASARKELLWTTFALLAILSYLKNNAPSTIHHPLFAFLHRHRVWIYTLLALLSKATAVMIPVILLLIDYTNGNLSKKSVKQKWALLTLAVVFGLLGLLGKTGGELSLSLWERIVLLPAQLMFALRLIVWPFRYAVLHPAQLPIELFTSMYGGSLVVVIALALLLWMMRRRFPLVILGSTIAFLTLLPGFLSPLHANTVTLVTEHYLYFPMIGLSIVLIGLAPQWQIANGKWQIVTTVLLILIGLLSIRTFKQVSTWRDTITLFESVQKSYPRSAPVLTNLGAAYARSEMYPEAESVLRQAVGLDPSLAQAHYNLGGLRYVRGDYTGAIASGKRVVELQPNHADAWRMLTWGYYRSGDIAKAREAYDTAIHLRPEFRDQLPALDGAKLAPNGNM